jgi:hypothetical protein
MLILEIILLFFTIRFNFFIDIADLHLFIFELKYRLKKNCELSRWHLSLSFQS